MKLRFCAAVKALIIAVIIGLPGVSFESKTFAAERLQLNPEAESASVSIVNFDDAEKRIFDSINRERGNQNLNNLDWNSDLSRLARRYSQQMADGNFFSHHDANGLSVVDRAESMKINGWSKIGENLFYLEGAGDVTSYAVKGWMKSPTHRRNILDAEWTASGIGVAQARDGRIYVTQVFMRR